MSRSLQILAGIVVLAGLAWLFAFFLSEPDMHDTKLAASRFDAASPFGAHLADAIRASPGFKKVTFGGCGHLDASPDSGPKGSLIFSPAVGSFARYSNFDDFLRLNPTLLSGHEECRRVSVLYMTIFPYRGQIDLVVDARGLIREKQGPVYFY